MVLKTVIKSPIINPSSRFEQDILRNRTVGRPKKKKSIGQRVRRGWSASKKRENKVQRQRAPLLYKAVGVHRKTKELVYGIVANYHIKKGEHIPCTGFGGKMLKESGSSNEKKMRYARLLLNEKGQRVIVDGSYKVAGCLGPLINSPAGTAFKCNVRAPRSVNGKHVATKNIAKGQQLWVGYGAMSKSIIGKENYNQIEWY